MLSLCSDYLQFYTKFSRISFSYHLSTMDGDYGGGVPPVGGYLPVNL